MRDLDQTDLDILRLLVEDGRRPYSELAQAVDLSPPAVSDRIDRLCELGIINRFTVDLDRTALAESTPVLVQLTPRPDAGTEVFEAAADLNGVDDVYRLANGAIVVHAHPSNDDTISWLDDSIDLTDVVELEVDTIVAHDERVEVQPMAFDLACVVCGNPVENGGELARFGGEIKAFCCESCLGRYEQQYDRLQERAD